MIAQIKQKIDSKNADLEKRLDKTSKELVAKYTKEFNVSKYNTGTQGICRGETGLFDSNI
jgi:hypothetical protein